MVTFWLALLIMVWPAFWMIEHFRTGWALYAATAGLTVATALASCSTLVAITESLPVRARGLFAQR